MTILELIGLLAIIWHTGKLIIAGINKVVELFDDADLSHYKEGE